MVVFAQTRYRTVSTKSGPGFDTGVKRAAAHFGSRRIMKMQVANANRRRFRASFRRSLGTLARPHAPLRVFRLPAPEPMRSELGQQILNVARSESPSEQARQRILDGVLAALRQLTSGAA